MFARTHQCASLLWVATWRNRNYMAIVLWPPLKVTRQKKKGKRQDQLPLSLLSNNLPFHHLPGKMSPYNTRSVARKQALETYKNTIASPSATGKGTHIRWTYSSDEEVPTLSHSNSLESEDSFGRPGTPRPRPRRVSAVAYRLLNRGL